MTLLYFIKMTLLCLITMSKSGSRRYQAASALKASISLDLFYRLPEPQPVWISLTIADHGFRKDSGKLPKFSNCPILSELSNLRTTSQERSLFFSTACPSPSLSRTRTRDPDPSWEYLQLCSRQFPCLLPQCLLPREPAKLAVSKLDTRDRSIPAERHKGTEMSWLESRRGVQRQSWRLELWNMSLFEKKMRTRMPVPKIPILNTSRLHMSMPNTSTQHVSMPNTSISNTSKHICPCQMCSKWMWQHSKACEISGVKHYTVTPVTNGHVCCLLCRKTDNPGEDTYYHMAVQSQHDRCNCLWRHDHCMWRHDHCN